VLKVFIGEDVDVVRRFNEAAGLSFPLLADADGRAAARYRVVRHPHTVVIDRRGRIVGRVEGERDWSSALAREWILGLLGEGS
jgi:peroxiredoxin